MSPQPPRDRRAVELARGLLAEHSHTTWRRLRWWSWIRVCAVCEEQRPCWQERRARADLRRTAMIHGSPLFPVDDPEEGWR